MGPPTKTCTKCLESKPLDAFHIHEGAADGRRSTCGVCRSAAVRAIRAHRPERTTLTLMVQRCHNPKHPKFATYGGRGILVCERWRESFETFLADVGPRPSPKHSIDRHPDPNGNYEPGNVRWATQKQQMRSTRINARLTAFGRTQLFVEWADETGIAAKAIKQRIRVLGWTPERAVTEPCQQRRSA